MAEHDVTNRIKVPLEDWVREIAREAAAEVIERHVKTCSGPKLEPRVRKLETRLAYLVGAILGSGLLGGSLGALIALAAR